jgi:hypothetical protein
VDPRSGRGPFADDSRSLTAALKCRQRRKTWLGQLQTKIDGLTAGKDRLKNIVQNLTDEVARMSAVLNSHRDCPGMSGSLAQVGLNTIPGSLPPNVPRQYPHGQPNGMMQHQQLMQGGRPQQDNGTGG